MNYAGNLPRAIFGCINNIPGVFDSYKISFWARSRIRVPLTFDDA